jgi:two-component system cell cycle sensor histidine kinase/response regulator CckA
MSAEGKTRDQLVSDLARATERIAELETTTVAECMQPEAAETEDHLRELVEHIPEVFWVHDTSVDQMAYVSPAYETIWGRAVPDLYQNFSDWFDQIHVDDRQRVCRAFISKAAEGHYDETYRIVRLDGRVRWIHDRGYPIRDGRGRVYRIVGMAQDITELRRTHVRLLKEETATVVRQLLTGLADESHHALQGNRVYLQRLRGHLEDHPDVLEGIPEALELVKEVQSTHDHLQSLYHQVLAYATPARRRRSACNLRNLLQESWNHSAGQRDGRLWQSRTDIDLFCEVDRSSIEVAFHYLLENSLSSGSRPLQIQVLWSEGEICGRPALQISLRDNGHGFPPGQVPRVFEPFYASGGLNMAIVERIVEGHGGEVSVAESSGPGGEIVLTLPRKSP